MNIQKKSMTWHGICFKIPPYSLEKACLFMLARSLTNVVCPTFILSGPTKLFLKTIALFAKRNICSWIPIRMTHCTFLLDFENKLLSKCGIGFLIFLLFFLLYIIFNE